MGSEFGIQREQLERNENQSDRGKPNRQKMQRKHRKNNKDDADRSRPYRSGMIEFGIESKRANREQHKRNIRIHEETEHLLLQGRLQELLSLAHQIQRHRISVEALNGFGCYLSK